MSEFKLKAEPPERDRLPDGTMRRLIGRWQELFVKRYGSKPYVSARDAAALRRIALMAGETKVAAALPAYLGLADAYLEQQGYPLSLLPDRWNRLVVEGAPAASSRVPDADITDAYLRTLRRR